jgi:hypothetical protein
MEPARLLLAAPVQGLCTTRLVPLSAHLANVVPHPRSNTTGQAFVMHLNRDALQDLADPMHLESTLPPPTIHIVAPKYSTQLSVPPTTHTLIWTEPSSAIPEADRTMRGPNGEI